GGTLAVGTIDGAVRLYNARTLQEIASFGGHGFPIPALAFAPDGKTLVTGGEDEVVRLWSVATGEEMLTLRPGGMVVGVAFSRDGRTLASAGADPDGAPMVHLYR